MPVAWSVALASASLKPFAFASWLGSSGAVHSAHHIDTSLAGDERSAADDSAGTRDSEVDATEDDEAVDVNGNPFADNNSDGLSDGGPVTEEAARQWNPRNFMRPDDWRSDYESPYAHSDQTPEAQLLSSGSSKAADSSQGVVEKVKPPTKPDRVSKGMSFVSAIAALNQPGNALAKKAGKARPIIFQDVDGVLNHSASGDGTVDPMLVDNLKGIVKDTGARLVISSAWRKSDGAMKELKKLTGPELAKEFYSKTPSLCPDTSCRAREIFGWMFSHPGATRGGWIAIDDRDIEAQNRALMKNYFVHTDATQGLTKAKAKQAVDLLREQNASIRDTKARSFLDVEGLSRCNLRPASRF